MVKNKLFYKVFDLKNEKGQILKSMAFYIGEGAYIIGELEGTKINCNTLPITKELIKKIYSLELVNGRKQD